MGQLVLYVVSVVVCVMGALFTSIGFRWLRKGLAAKSWPSTGGVVVEHWDSLSPEQYVEGVVYKYAVDGTEHWSRDVRTGSFDSGVQRGYPVGKSVTVHYDPDHVGDAVLEPGVGAATYLFLAGGILALVIGLFLFQHLVRFGAIPFAR